MQSEILQTNCKEKSKGQFSLFSFSVYLHFTSISAGVLATVSPVVGIKCAKTCFFCLSEQPTYFSKRLETNKQLKAVK